MVTAAVCQPLAARPWNIVCCAAAASRWKGCGSNSAAKLLIRSSSMHKRPELKVCPTEVGVTLKAGPWFSNKEAKVICILDMDDPANDFGLFANALASGRTFRRRLTPIVD